MNINFIPLEQVHNNLLNPSKLQSSNYRAIEIKNCSEYNQFVTKDSNLINTRIYFKQENVYFLIENSYLFMYEKNQWTMSSNNYSNPQCQNDYLMFDKIDDTDAILQERMFALHKLKFFTFYQSKRGPSLSEEPQLEGKPTEKEIYRGEELKEFVDGKLKEEEGATAGLSLLSRRISPNKETNDVSREIEDKIGLLQATETKLRHSIIIPQNTTAKNTELRQLNQNSEQTTGETEEKTTKF